MPSLHQWFSYSFGQILGTKTEGRNRLAYDSDQLSQLISSDQTNLQSPKPGISAKVHAGVLHVDTWFYHVLKVQTRDNLKLHVGENDVKTNAAAVNQGLPFFKMLRVSLLGLGTCRSPRLGGA